MLQHIFLLFANTFRTQVVEDDLIFPCGSQPDWIKSEVVPTIPQTPSTDTVHDPYRSFRLARKSSSSRLVTSLFPSDPNLTDPDDPFANPQESERIDYLEVLDPKNHGKLKAAWDRMLLKCFLPPGLLSVLQFYFTAEFDEEQTFPPLQVALPPNTRMYEVKAAQSGPPVLPPVSPMLDNVALRDFLTAADSQLEEYCGHAEDGFAGPVTSTTWAAMHLGRMVALVIGCKQAIFEEYKSLEGPPPTTQNAISDMKDEFNAAWLNWEWCVRKMMRKNA